MSAPVPKYEDARALVDEFLEQYLSLEILQSHAEYGERLVRAGERPVMFAFVDTMRTSTDAKRVLAAMLLLVVHRDTEGLVSDNTVKEATEFIPEGLNAAAPDVYLPAAVLMCCSGIVPKGVVKHLKAWLSSDEAMLRVCAATALSGTRSVSAKAIQILGEGLRSDDPDLVAAAAMAMPRLRVRIKEAIAICLDALEHTVEPGTQSIVAALAEMAPHGRTAIPKLVRLFESPDSSLPLKVSLVTALGKLRQSGDRAEEALLAALDGNDWTIISHVVHALQDDDRLISKAADAMVRRLACSDPDIRGIAARALLGSNIPSAAVVPALMMRLKEETEPDAFRAIVSAIGAIGAPALPALLDEFKLCNVRTMYQVQMALIAVGRTSPQELLQAFLSSEDRDALIALGGILCQIGPRVVAVVPKLVELLEMRGTEHQRVAARALTRIGARGKDAAPALVNAIRDVDDECAEWIQQSLVSIGPEITAVVRAAWDQGRQLTKYRLAPVLKRLTSNTVQQPSTAEDIAMWNINAKLLELFALVGNVLKERGPTSYRELETCLSELADRGTASNKIRTSAAYIRTKVKELESVVSQLEGRPIVLLLRNGTRATSLTPDGQEFLARSVQFLEKRRLRPK